MSSPRARSSPSPSLKAFAATFRRGRPGPPCWVCGLPEATALNEARRGGTAIAVLLAFLQTPVASGGAGYPLDVATRGRLRGHFDARHHER